MRILNNLIERLDIPRSKVFINVSKYGNTSAASIPIALDEANRNGLLVQGIRFYYVPLAVVLRGVQP
jgi:3-oxoacyl-[acyl-carrier-protein] synthase III